MAQRNARLGLWLFGLYVLLYGSFVLVNAFAPDEMERTPWLGVNLAIWSGFGLIVAAIVLSLVYGFLCRSGSDGNGEEPRQ
jgi:uncharacterized membrane protein (DUF485 family)